MSQVTISSHLSGFIALLERTVSKLVEWHPDPELRAFKTAVEMGKSVNPRLFLSEFNEKVGKKYYKEILNKQESFFTNLENLQKDRDFQQIMQNNGDSASFYFEKITVFTKGYQNLTDKQKNQFWRMLKGLVKIGAVGSKDEVYKQTVKQYLKDHPEVMKN